jgi:hypothetical protein
MRLREAGRLRAGAWLAANFDLLGRASSVDLRQRYL